MKDTKEVLLTSDSSGESWSAALWDPRTGSLLSQYRNASPLGPNSLNILGKTYLISADASKPRIHIWPLNSQVPVANLRLTPPGKVSSLTCSSCGTFIAAAVDEKVFIWQTSTGKLLRTLARHYQAVTSLKFSPDDGFLASGGQDGLVFVWSFARILNNFNESAPLHGFSDHTLGVKDIHLGTGKSRLISVSLDRTARIYDANSGTQLLVLVFDVPLTSVTMDARECSLFIGCSNGQIRMLDLRNPPRGREHHVPAEKDGAAVFKGHSGSVTSLSVSVDCVTLVSGAADGNVNVWDVPSRQVIRNIQHKGQITNAVLVPAFGNFRADVLKVKTIVKPLQRVLNDSTASGVMEIISRDDVDELLRPEDYFSAQTEDRGDIEKELCEARAEIEKQKKINSEMYKFGVKCLLNKK